MFSLSGSVPETAWLFEHATQLLGGRSPREVVGARDAEVVHSNRIGQILCSLQGLAAALALEVMSGRLVVAGYSVGEVAAWGVGGLLHMRDALDLVGRRADVMDAVSGSDDGLLFVRGLSRAAVERLCEQYGCDIAILNPGEAFVIGGGRVALGALGQDARALKAAHVVSLPVNVASHTGRLAPAAVEFRASLGLFSVNLARVGCVRVLSGVDGSPVLDAEAGRDKLAAQISHTVRWADCLQGCIEAGATGFLELGPGAALSKMAAAAYPGIPARSLEEFKTLQGARAWVARLSM
jgi:[acyl-carrier-protein] S-malonyltransferase